MRVLVSGNLGYIGSVLTGILQEKGFEVVGLDAGFYEDCLLYEDRQSFQQIRKDIRDVTHEDVEGVDAVVHLAALSNDPLGEFDPRLTEAINLRATLRLAEIAREGKVQRFVYASSQSMYGISQTDEELDEEAPKNPITVYAKTKWEAECELKKLSTDKFVVVCFRPSTVFGVSPRLRCDIVFNNLVASAYINGRIEVKSNGTPWRPVVHVRDVCEAFMAGLNAPQRLIERQSFNVGIRNGNYTIKDLAEAAQKAVKGSVVAFTGEHGSDSRTYKISFDRILSVLKDYYYPQWNLITGGEEMVNLFKRINFSGRDFYGRKCVRLQQLLALMQGGQLNKDLKWISERVLLVGEGDLA